MIPPYTEKTNQPPQDNK